MLDTLIIGAGPAGLFAADRLSEIGHTVLVIDRMPSPARKFLMAGRGGLNLTHSEGLDAFLPRYREAEAFLAPLIEAFPPESLRTWCDALGADTFAGTSGRVFPKAMKASPLLRAWLKRLETRGVEFRTRTTWLGFPKPGIAQLEAADGAVEAIQSRSTLLATGGASWAKLGSNGRWAEALTGLGVAVHPLKPANCGFQIGWTPFVSEKFAGTPLKRIGLTVGSRTVKGEAVLSGKGLEGGVIYALSAEIRNMIETEGHCDLKIDLLPDLNPDQVAQRLSKQRGKQSVTTFLRKALKLSPAEIALARETSVLASEPSALARQLKSVKLRTNSPYPIDRAISSAGGIALSELDDRMMLKRHPGVFAAGEMLDWEAPTGGYLLQACFATGYAAANGIHAYLAGEQMELPI
ncbi:TIGR03862 family flavoprotein [Roseibium sp. RKSG952]|uniref:TIGR03862 family flavoprotein n=1 Tax=Roseibium sp. RKSG952 TaxID=2529384 RepID=UPI0012BBB814|nr:TIGR03862 family flavoprotein [Roseibium sp. RKSG952]MTH99817.1 TIGR03862 family flavoprotein [Roseibium sp. RKSG952]